MTGSDGTPLLDEIEPRVRERILQIWAPQVAEEWLTGSEPHLDGARPIDVCLLGETEGLLDALDYIEQGGMG